MKLIVAEKPSVAGKIAAALGINVTAAGKRQGHYDGPDYLVSWCYGHLVDLAEPSDYDPAYKRWSLDTLPIIPANFQYKVNENTAPQFEVLKTLSARTDVTELIAATDAGREGELIFRLVYNLIGCKKPVLRLWAESMESDAILAAMTALRPISEYDGYYQAALCRQHADWLIGINLTRFYTKAYDQKLPVGRVQTPTLMFTVRRQNEIDAFVPTPYYNVIADFGNFKVLKRMDTQVAADTLCGSCAGSGYGVVTALRKSEVKTNPPKLFNLTGLQKEANRLLGYTAQETLDYAQSLYEKGLATYPRAPSQYLTTDMAAPMEALIHQLLQSGIFDQAFQSSYQLADVNITKVINDKQVTDHPAILPTTSVTPERVAALSSGERNIILILCHQLLAAVYRPHRCATTKVTVTIGSTDFEGLGQQMLDNGFRAVLAAAAQAVGAPRRGTDSVTLPPLAEGDSLRLVNVSAECRQTKPPEAYTDETLLAAMETAGREIENEDERNAMKNCGLGTEATRASIIEGLCHDGYIVRKKKRILPTQLGRAFISVVSETLQSPELTGHWEKALADIQSGDGSPSAFMSEVTTFLRNYIPAAKASIDPDDVKRLSGCHTLGVCPICGRNVVEYPMSYSCESGKDGCGFVVWKQIAGKDISKDDVAALLSNGESKLIHGFTSRKTGKKFSAYLILKEDHTVGFRFPPPEKRVKIPPKKFRRR